MKNPYEVLGLEDNADINEVRRAYRALAAKYDPSNFSEGALAEQAARRMEEINNAYDAIIMNTNYSTSGGYNSYDASYGRTDFGDVRKMIENGRLDDAETRLDGIAPKNRSAEWYYLKGTVLKKRGWFEQANENFAQAQRMDPTNTTYSNAYQNMNNQSDRSYRAQQREKDNDGCMGDCSLCNICEGLICADCCCECMGGDLIRCC